MWKPWLGWWIYHSEFLTVSNRSRHWLKPKKEFTGRNGVAHWVIGHCQLDKQDGTNDSQAAGDKHVLLQQVCLEPPWAPFPSGSVLCYHCSACFLSLNRHHGHHRKTSQLLQGEREIGSECVCVVGARTHTTEIRGVGEESLAPSGSIASASNQDTHSEKYSKILSTLPNTIMPCFLY